LFWFARKIDFCQQRPQAPSSCGLEKEKRPTSFVGKNFDQLDKNCIGAFTLLPRRAGAGFSELFHAEAKITLVDDGDQKICDAFHD
jgi:hypothetical protein